MSEFTYACPVCGQHIKCDSSQAGTVMQCPTCFQKITVPQAPATADAKFIITGTKVGDRPMPKVADAGPIAPASRKGFPVGALILVLLVCGAAAAVFAFRGKIFKSAETGTNQVVNASDEDGTGTASTGPQTALIAPPANDTNWMLNLAGATIPDGTVVGRIHGQNFIIERAVLQNGLLTLRVGRAGPVSLGLQINFGDVQPEALAGQSVNIATNAPKAARVNLIWQEGNQVTRQMYQGGYALRLDFGQVSGNRLPGAIYLCAPDTMRSYVFGNFNAEIRKPKPRRQN